MSRSKGADIKTSKRAEYEQSQQLMWLASINKYKSARVSKSKENKIKITLNQKKHRVELDETDSYLNVKTVKGF